MSLDFACFHLFPGSTHRRTRTLMVLPSVAIRSANIYAAGSVFIGSPRPFHILPVDFLKTIHASPVYKTVNLPLKSHPRGSSVPSSTMRNVNILSGAFRSPIITVTSQSVSSLAEKGALDLLILCPSWGMFRLPRPKFLNPACFPQFQTARAQRLSHQYSRLCSWHNWQLLELPVVVVLALVCGSST